MFACICMGVSESEVHECASQGARTVEAVGEVCGAGTGCGNCHGRLRRMIEGYFSHTEKSAGIGFMAVSRLT